MKLSSLKYFQHSLNFKSNFKTSSQKLLSRDIFILKMHDDNGNEFYGEAAPLPNFNSESFEEVENILRILSENNSFDLEESLEVIFDSVKNLTSLPTLQFALEQIFLSTLLSRQSGLFDGISIDQNISVNAVLGIEEFKTAKEKLAKLINDGFSVVKLKTNDEQFEDLYNLIVWAQDGFPNKMKFRIDPNRSWNFKNTLMRIEKLKKCPVQYIEEPVAEKSELFELSKKSAIPIGADESVRSLKDAEDVITNSNLKFLVIKPMLFGGIRKLLQLKKLIENQDIKIVLSSAFESNIGRRHLILSAAMLAENITHGFATSDLLTNQPAGDVFPVKNGMIDFSLEKYISKIIIND